MGLYASSVIKKRRFWPKYIPGHKLDTHLKDKPVGTQEVACGILDSIPYNVFCMKEPDFVMKVMSTYGNLLVSDGQLASTRTFERNGLLQKLTFL